VSEKSVEPRFLGRAAILDGSEAVAYVETRPAEACCAEIARGIRAAYEELIDVTGPLRVQPIGTETARELVEVGS
jgi:hypothetical protein